MNKHLELYQLYSREEVCSLFESETIFKAGTGTWGLHGIISLKDRDNDFVFFVSYGREQKEHKFDEGITSEGVLTWQSQPSQNFSNEKIKSLIHHDEALNNIYLFLRPSIKGKYYYLGNLKYVTHDSERQNPVYFQWQILDWDPPNDIVSLLCTEEPENEVTADPKYELRINPPPVRNIKGITTVSFRGQKGTDFDGKSKRNKKLGLEGEELIFLSEIKKLEAIGQNELAEKVRHASKEEGDGLGYDILSYDESGNEMLIEVKTTKGPETVAFNVTAREALRSEKDPDKYYIYRVYNYDSKIKSGDCYIVRGDILKNFNVEPTEYRCAGVRANG
jgi:hypothetical protein